MNCRPDTHRYSICAQNSKPKKGSNLLRMRAMYYSANHKDVKGKDYNFKAGVCAVPIDAISVSSLRVSVQPSDRYIFE